MSNKIILKHGAGAPADGVLDEAELGFDTLGHNLYIGYSDDGALKVASIGGASAYEYARNGGYTGTEEDFIQKITSEYISREEVTFQTVRLTLEDGSTILAKVLILLE